MCSDNAEKNQIPASNRLCSREQIRETDRRTIEEFGISGETLMEIAGGKAAEWIASHFSEGSSGVLFCGHGNNGGDALVSARYLADRYRHHLTIVLAKPEFHGTPGWNHHFALLKALPLDRIRIVSWAETKSEWLQSATPFAEFDYIVDGLTGTGLMNSLRAPLDAIVERINRSNRPVFSLDIPSGLDTNTGQILGSCVKATTTLTFGSGKIGLYLEDGPAYAGDVITIELPFPSHLQSTGAMLANGQLLHTVMKRNDIPISQPSKYKATRTAEHKYATGTVHILAGSEGLTGAAILAAQSAWDHGAGAVLLYSPAHLLPVYEKNLPRVIKIVVDDDGKSSQNPDQTRQNPDKWYNPTHIPNILNKIHEKPGVILLGPGVGRHPETLEFCRSIITETIGTYPLILDADALYAIDPQALRTTTKTIVKRTAACILTPHPGELRKALNIAFHDDHTRLEAVKRFAAENNCFLYSKGYPSIFANPQNMAWITGYDTRVYARAGTGDQLAGAIAATLNQFQEPEDAVMMASIPQPLQPSHSSQPSHPFQTRPGQPVTQ